MTLSHMAADSILSHPMGLCWDLAQSVPLWTPLPLHTCTETVLNLDTTMTNSWPLSLADDYTLPDSLTSYVHDLPLHFDQSHNLVYTQAELRRGKSSGANPHDHVYWHHLKSTVINLSRSLMPLDIVFTWLPSDYSGLHHSQYPCMIPKHFALIRCPWILLRTKHR